MTTIRRIFQGSLALAVLAAQPVAAETPDTAVSAENERHPYTDIIEANSSECEAAPAADGPLPHINTYSVGQGAILIVVPCNSYAYNFSSYIYLDTPGKNGERSYRPLAVPLFQSFENGKPLFASQSEVFNYDFDPETLTLRSYSKGRGIGDCGTANEWRLIVDGEKSRFDLLKAWNKKDCDGEAFERDADHVIYTKAANRR